MRYVVLDTETTGLETSEGHRIIEVGCVEILNRKITGQRYHQYLNPERDIDEGALAVHGITKDFLKDKPTFAEIATDFMAFIQDAVVIIHNAPFDTAFINYELMLAKQRWKPLTQYCQIIDTLVLARQLHAGQRNSLDALCKRYHIDNSHRELHGALLDAHLLAQVYLAMTGGQGSLFDDVVTATDQPQNRELASLKTPQIQVDGVLKVISANASELELHAKKLQEMAKNGLCLWNNQQLIDNN
ncbi:MAG: DNA polymerase III subunit epsilon [Gammaproteobacteria bacterium]|nr:DNA polymerase III subunit epsilon [Gammaproteobacteria bacterium]